MLLQIGDSVLTKSDVLAQMPQGLSPTDSLNLFDAIVKEWTERLMLEEVARENLPNIDKINRIVEDYRPLLLRSVLGFVFAIVTAVGMGAPMEVIDMTVNMTRQWTLLCWLWPLLILRVFRALGEGRIGTGGAAISLLGMQLGEGLLLPLLTAGKIGFPMFGVAGPSLASGISPLFGLLILHIATRLHKKKLTGVN